MMKKWLFSKRFQLLAGLLVLISITYYLTLEGTGPREQNLDITRRARQGNKTKTPKNTEEAFRASVIENIERTLRESLKEDKGTGCMIPQLDPFSDEIMKFNTEFVQINCTGKDWVKCRLSECRVVPEILSTVADIVCYYEDIIHHSDNRRTIGTATEVMSSDVYVLTKSDHVVVSCTGWDPKLHEPLNWKGYSVGFRKLKPPPPDDKPKPINVLILGFDSTAKNGFIRRMPKSYKFVTEEMKAVILNGFNTVGDGTPATLFPILTGKTELELPDVRKQWGPKRTLDEMPFIFYKLKKDGWRTAYFEDMPWIGTFQYRFNGFKRQPADHYLRSFFLEESNGGSRWWKSGTTKYCVGDTPRFKVMLNITDQFLQFPEKKYTFTFIADITHDNFNLISNADEDLVRFLEKFMEDKRNEDTLFILLGDHGPRYANVRQTIQGKLEERLPLMAILLPNKLLEKRPQALRYLKENANVLTTPHDIYATVLDAIGKRRYWNHYKVEGADLKRGLTLLEPIPANRSCSEAGIEPHWCSCLSWENVSQTDPMYYKTASALVDFINSLTQSVRSSCVKRELDTIEWINVHKPRRGVLRFQGARDPDGYVGKFKDYRQDTATYQVRITISPGKGAYEASLKYVIASGKFVIHSKDISRTNAYNDEPHCISDTHPHLNMYCYCQK